jgi:hypothetical protein
VTEEPPSGWIIKLEKSVPGFAQLSTEQQAAVLDQACRFRGVKRIGALSPVEIASSIWYPLVASPLLVVWAVPLVFFGTAGVAVWIVMAILTAALFAASCLYVVWQRSRNVIAFVAGVMSAASRRQCTWCGYSLIGLSGTGVVECPECGRPTSFGPPAAPDTDPQESPDHRL